MEKTLKEFVPGESGVVKKLTAQGQLKRHLLDMGITPGAEIVFRKVAPMGDPIEITIRGYELSVRKEEASSIIMESRGGTA